MGDLQSPPAVTHPPPSPTGSSIPMLYYGLFVIATAAIVLVLYNLVIIKWCMDFGDWSRRRTTSRHHGPALTWQRHSSGVSLISSFKYKNDGGGNSDCAVCLSVFEEGEQVKKLPKCNHSFHTPCIDMWFYSHMDCPLCRSTVEPPQQNKVSEQALTIPQQHTITVRLEEHSR